MTDTTSIKCPHCGRLFEPSEAFRHELSEEIRLAEKKRHEEELSRAREETEKSVTQRLATEAKVRMEQLEKDAAEEKDRNRRLLKQLEDMTGELRQLRRKDEERELEMKKILAQEETKIREEARKKAFEEHELKDLEKDKMIADYKKKAEELQAKLTQGSQQTQGEVLELAMEEVLRREFPTDAVEEVKKGQRGADILQRVIDKRGNECGTILWESKNAQWQNDWPAKLREDQRQAKADIAILVVTKTQKPIEHYLYQDNIWICQRTFIVPLAFSLRYMLVKLNFERTLHIGKDEKKEELYAYINSKEFVQRMEAIKESFDSMQDEVEREKRWFQTKWARQEKQLRKVIDYTFGMYGDLQGVVGKSLPELKGSTSTIDADSETLPLIEEDKPF